ncbi:MAG: hypothetical protein JNL28_13265 [Planctomycetes bacterium]|nr:hypothetical protein [Planctomycetota bacterium]
MLFPMFGFALLAFLILALVVAVAVFFIFKSGEQGKTKLNGCAGCAIGFALLAIAGLGALGLVFVSVVSLPSEAVRHGPVKALEFHWDESAPAPDEPGRQAAASPLHVRVEMRGVKDHADVMKWLRKRTKSETHIAVHEEVGEDGEAYTVAELSLPVSKNQRRELKELRSQLERDMPDFNIPSGVRIELRGPND